MTASRGQGTTGGGGGAEHGRVRRAAAAIRKAARGPGAVEVGVVLGSGLSGAVPLDRVDRRLAYTAIPGFPRPGVEGHAGELRLGRVGERRVALLSGRAHLYEGVAVDEVVRPVRTLIELGATTLIVTNAAGGVRLTLRPGDVLGIEDHLNLQGAGPDGGGPQPFGPRFIKMVHAYDPELLRLAARVARRGRVPFRRGVYAGVRGPAYETPAEVGMLRKMGAAAVGMSTVQEVMAARQMGARCLGLSLIANAAHGHHAGNVTHEEVLEAMERNAARLGRVILGVIREMP